MGRAVARVLALARRVPQAQSHLGLVADIPGTFPSPAVATGLHSVGVGTGVVGFLLGLLTTNFLLGPLKLRGASESSLLPPPPSTTIVAYLYWCRSLPPTTQKLPLPTQPEKSFKTKEQSMSLPC